LGINFAISSLFFVTEFVTALPLAREIGRFFRPQRNSLFWEIVPPQSRHNKFTENALM
jgi:hypothetical protein